MQATKGPHDPENWGQRLHGSLFPQLWNLFLLMPWQAPLFSVKGSTLCLCSVTVRGCVHSFIPSPRENLEPSDCEYLEVRRVITTFFL
jgi:hypothetical protein